MPRDVFLELISLVILGMIEPWPECQPEESRLREEQPEDSSIYVCGHFTSGLLLAPFLVTKAQPGAVQL